MVHEISEVKNGVVLEKA